MLIGGCPFDAAIWSRSLSVPRTTNSRYTPSSSSFLLWASTCQTTPLIALGMPLAIAMLSSSALVLATADGPSYTTDCHKSQSTGAAGSVIAEGPADTPDAVPGARSGLVIDVIELAGGAVETGDCRGLAAPAIPPSFSSTILVGLPMPRPTLAPRPISAARAPPLPAGDPTSCPSRDCTPASSLIRSILNLSLRLFLCRFVPVELSDSWPSSSLLSISSGFEPIETTEVTVLRLSRRIGS